MEIFPCTVYFVPASVATQVSMDNLFLRDQSTERMLISWNDMGIRDIRLGYDDITSSW